MGHPLPLIDPAITGRRQRRGRPEGECRYPRRRGNIAVNPGKICIARGSSVLAGRHAGGMCGRDRRTLPITPTRPRVITGPETGPLGHVNTVNTGRWISLSLSSSLSALSGWIEYLCWLAAFEAARARISKGSQRVESDGGGFF